MRRNTKRKMKRFIRNLETRDKIILGVLIGIIILMIIAFIILLVRKNNAEGEPPDDSVASVVTDKSYTLYLDTVKGVSYYYTMQYDQGLADDGRQFLTVPQGGRVTFEIVLDDDSKEVSDISIKYGWNKNVEYTVDDMVVDFTMPSGDVEVRPELSDKKIIEAAPTEVPDHVISVDGVTDAIRQAMQGRYDEELFVRSLKNALSLDSGNSSAYSDISSITFTGEIVNDNPNVVGLVAVLNKNTQKKVYVQFQLDSGDYLFTLNYMPTPTATPVPVQTATKTPTATTKPSQPHSGSAGSSTGASSSSPQSTSPQSQSRPQTTTTTTTFSLSGITNEFNGAVGNVQEFLDILYDYIYHVYPDVQRGELNGFSYNGSAVTFRITLDNSVVIDGRYNTSDKTISIN